MARDRNERDGVWVADRRVFLKSLAAVAAGPSLLSLSCATRETSVSRRPVRFGVVTDCHYADIDVNGTRFYRQSLDKLAECVTQIKAENVDFLIELGDFKDQKSPAVEAQTLAYLDEVEAVLQQFGGPTYHVLGNHDMDSISKAQFLEHVDNTGVDPKRSYYSFDVPNLHCVVLDANYKADGTNYDHGNYVWTDTTIPARELEWLEADLAAARDRTVVFIHQPLDGTRQEYIRNAADVRDILQRSGKVLGVFQGHIHQGGYSHIEGIHYCTQRALVEGNGPESNAYAVVEVSPGGDIVVTGYRRALSRELPTPAMTVAS